MMQTAVQVCTPLGEPGGARGSQEDPERPRRTQKDPGATRRTLEDQHLVMHAKTLR